jgi:16S rRNA processing protein RimM
MSSHAEPHAWTVLAHLLRPQGRKGEVLAELFTDFPELFSAGGDHEHHDKAEAAEGVRTSVFLAPPNFTGSPAEARPITITNHWLPVGRNHGRVVLAFQGIDSINLAETLNGLDVLIPSSERVELEDDAEYIDELIGCHVIDAGVDIGIVMDVQFPTTADGTRRLTGAAPLLTVETPAGDEILIPYVKNFLNSLQPDEKRIEMTLPAGLLDLNRP